jgi:hypothetical protein
LLIVLNWFFNAFVLDMKLNMNFPFSRKFWRNNWFLLASVC